MKNTVYKVTCRIICVIDPLGDKEHINLSLKMGSVIKREPNKLGKAVIELRIYENDISNLKEGFNMTITDEDEKVKTLEGWVPQILSKTEYKITKHINDDNAVNMIEELMKFRYDVREAIMNEPVKVS